MMIRRIVPNPWLEAERVQNEMNRLFNAAFSRSQSTPCFPAINVWASDEKQIVTAELPGIGLEDLEINVVGQTLTISGERKAPQLPEGARYHRQECGHGKFTRSLSLLYPVDMEKVEAALENGVLRIVLPRAEQDKPRKIAVRVS
mgnify:CR=1 FL=1